MKFVCRVYSGKSNHKEDSKLNIFTAKLANECNNIEYIYIQKISIFLICEIKKAP